MESLGIGFNVQTIAIVITLISLVITFITVLKKKGWKEALLAVMRTIQKVKVDQATKEDIEAAILISCKIKKHWDKDSKIKSVAKVGQFIDAVYDAQVKDLGKWKKKMDIDCNLEKYS